MLLEHGEEPEQHNHAAAHSSFKEWERHQRTAAAQKIKGGIGGIRYEGDKVLKLPAVEDRGQ